MCVRSAADKKVGWCNCANLFSECLKNKNLPGTYAKFEERIGSQRCNLARPGVPPSSVADWT